MQAKHHVNASRCTPIIAEVANNIFQQNWRISTGVTDNASNELKNVLPSKSAITNAIEDATILSLKKVGEEVLRNRAEGGINTLHFDDTVKKSGAKSFDVKTLLITTASMSEGEEKVKKSHSLGFEENLSHKAEDGADTVKNMLSRVAVLIGVSYDEFLDLMDYSMTDRGGDVESLLEELGLPKENRMKCNAHILLCIDSSLNKSFKDFEVKVGVENLLGKGLESTHVLSSSDSVWTLGLIAFSKLLSADNSVDTISLHGLYNKFLIDESENGEPDNAEIAKKLLNKGFKKFVANRRVVKLLKRVDKTNVDRKHMIIDVQDIFYIQYSV